MKKVLDLKTVTGTGKLMDVRDVRWRDITLADEVYVDGILVKSRTQTLTVK